MSANLLIIVLTVLVSMVGFSNPKVIEALLLWPPAISRRSEFYRFVSYGAVHGDLMHLLFNMVTLYFFGRMIEVEYQQALGQFGYVGFYVAALVASILPTYLRHRDDPAYRSLGASGAVSAVLFSYILFRPWDLLIVFVVPVPAILYAVLYTIYSVVSERRGKDNINHSAHLWGAGFGVACTLLLVPGAGQTFLLRIMGG